MLKEQIEQLFEVNSNYHDPGQAVNQASSLDSLSSDLYTDSNRFIYELLQNADDSYKDGSLVKVWIKLFDDNLVIAHTGSAFSNKDVRGICNVNNGTKQSDPNKTGYKGIGFKAVFGQSKKVTIFSENEYFSFDSSYQHEWKWSSSGTQEEWEEENDRKFELPWQIIPISTQKEDISDEIDQFIQYVEANVATIIKISEVNLEETKEAVKEISENINTFIFLKSICEITFEVVGKDTIKINRENEHIITVQKNEESATRWLAKEKNLQIPKEVMELLKDERNIPKKLLEATSIQLTLAAKIGGDGLSKLVKTDKKLYSYLPTEESKYDLPVLVNTSFLTTANRESLHVSSKWNQWIFKEIAVKLFEWIAELVQGEYALQAYHLLPTEIHSDSLGKSFNQGFSEALETIPFVLCDDGDLLKIDKVIIDSTNLSNKSFVERSALTEYIERKYDKEITHTRKYSSMKQFESKLKQLGAKVFNWIELSEFLSSHEYQKTFLIENNIELIKYLKNVAEDEKVTGVSNYSLEVVPFLYSHKNKLISPNRVCFPEPSDQNWNNPDSELDFIHQELYNWLIGDIETRQWLEKIGVIEKTDLTYITQSLIPQIDTYVRPDNAVEVINGLFSLHLKGEITNELFVQLETVKLLTTTGELVPANQCYLSDSYHPRLPIETILEHANFVDAVYYKNSDSGKDEWKQFFLKLKVQEGITLIKNTNVSELEPAYRRNADQSYKPYMTTFSVDDYKDLVSFSNVKYTIDDAVFATQFWQDVIGNYTIQDFSNSAVGYWGNWGYPGRTTGNPIENYIPWFIKNMCCIPTSQNKCELASDVFLNIPEIVKITGDYLPVFNQTELTPDWKSFFKFKTDFVLSDYLEVLTQIWNDTEEEMIKLDNKERIQQIYLRLLELCENFSSDDIATIEAWSQENYLLTTNDTITKCSELKYFIDGNESVFQSQYEFIAISAENRRHPSLEKLLEYFGVQILRQSQFKLEHSQLEECSELFRKLEAIIPVLVEWIEQVNAQDTSKMNVDIMTGKLSDLKIFQSRTLKITYDDTYLEKNINTHFIDNQLYLTKPWNSNSVLVSLPDRLANYFGFVGHDRKIEFLIRSTTKEMRDYLNQENIDISESLFDLVEESMESYNEELNQSERPLPNTRHTPNRSYNSKQVADSLVERAVRNIIDYLNQLPEYDCSGHFQIAPSIIGGITKNDIDVTIVARPSDDGKVLLYYTSEFDVLNYVNAELWYEDGLNFPKKMSMGQLLENTEVNRIPLPRLEITEEEIADLANQERSETFEYSAVPDNPQKIAKTISSFANHLGGKIVFGINENGLEPNEIIGLSREFKMNEIMEKAITLVNPVPHVVFNWINHEEKRLFAIEVSKHQESVYCEGVKYNRELINDVPEINQIATQRTLMKADYSRTFAVIIAVENYATSSKGKITSVKYAKKDAMAFKEMLETSLGVEEENIYMYIDDDALKSRLKIDFRNLCNILTETDRLIFYYAGHGFHDGASNYLATHDTFIDALAETSISLRSLLLDPLMKSECNNALIFIDACATKIKVDSERGILSDLQFEEFETITHKYPYYATFLSCQNEESSFSSDVLENGIWTYHLVNALKGNQKEILKDGNILTDIDLQKYLSDSVPKYTKQELQKEQHPKSILDSQYENVIVKYS